MAKILVVDDSAVDRRMAGALLEKRPGLEESDKQTNLTVLNAVHGKEALAMIAADLPDLVLTDLRMPEMNGLELVEEVKARYPSVPVILMTAHGSEDIAIQALQRGAASYVPKKNLAQDLLETVEDVLAVARSRKHQQRMLEDCWRQSESYYVLPNNIEIVSALISHLQDHLRQQKFCGENTVVRLGVALREALSNAIIHGNLEVNSELRETDEKTYYAQIDERRVQEPYRGRQVFVTVRMTREEVHYIVLDDGRGFDPTKLPDPTDPENLAKASGRGLLLIRTFMDEVKHNATGNEITMMKRRTE